MAIDKLTVIERQARPRAIAKEKDGVVLYWVEELQVAGIHGRGLANLLGCNNDLIVDTTTRLKGEGLISILEAETLTPGGIQGVGLITEADLPKVLRRIERGKAKAETRDRAGDIRDRLAAAGFKLMVMLELAPQQLKAQVDDHVDKMIRLQELKNEGMAIASSVMSMHGPQVLAMIMGQSDQVIQVETSVTEVVEPETGRSTKILTASQLKRLVKERTGQNLKSLTAFTDSLRAAGRDDLLVPVTRNHTSEYPIPDRIDEAIAIVYGTNRQTLIGE
ncbi:MAG TPA: hypothetical protein V6D19_07210 [Stenomitos sp.]